MIEGTIHDTVILRNLTFLMCNIFNSMACKSCTRKRGLGQLGAESPYSLRCVMVSMPMGSVACLKTSTNNSEGRNIRR